MGEVTAACGERVELAFNMDRASAGGNSYGFAPATGNLMYCMPQVGTKAALYLGSGNEAQGVVSGCIRTNGALCEGTGSPEKKGFCLEHGKGMSLYPQSMGMDGGEAGKLTMEDGSGTLLESSGSLLLLAKEGIRLESMTGIAVQGVSDIMALCGAGTSSLCVNGSVDMTGGLTGLGGSTYRNYAPYADAPEEGEFDWVGLATNLIMGLAVGAACIAMSFLLPGIGTIAAGALMGAGMGAISASVAGAIGDYSSGNVRSTEEAMRDVAVSMVSGALTGAITGGLGAKLASAFPKAAKVVGKIPLADWAKVGLFNTGDGILGRLVYAVADGNMSVEEKFAYAFSPEHMAMDFVGGAAMYGMSKVLPKVREKLPWNKISNEGGKYSSFGEMSFKDGKQYSAWNKLREEGLTFEQAEKIKHIEKGQKPAPETYLSDEYIQNHLQSFKDSGAVKIMPNEPSGTIGGKGGTFVMSGDILDEIIRYANGDISKIEDALGLDSGYLGKNPVIVMMDDSSNVRMPSGNELGAWPEYWEPGGYTSGGIKEAVIAPVPEGEYTYKFLFE